MIEPYAPGQKPEEFPKELPIHRGDQPQPPEIGPPRYPHVDIPQPEQPAGPDPTVPEQPEPIRNAG